ncbi:MAG TPA: UDP-N-acetylglucosamine 2-epimerase (non-hydrolyzing) [Thermoanaerobaculia bacterium]|nr:UDP-N-acetylglucosamine 2-epimerase (non-hydrolyzing) [Thermoanaerobaculia bacterium]
MSSPLQILAVYGTRPEAIKMAPVIAALRRRPDRFIVTVVTTGQHRELLEPVQDLFGLRPDLDLRLMTPDQTLNGLAASSLSALDEVLRDRQPDWLLVQGDTTTAMSAALAAFHRGVAVGHVEAGLRTGNLAQPFPEEANRRIVDLLAGALFAPTERAGRALRAEGRERTQVHVVGNTVIDALRSLEPACFSPSSPGEGGGEGAGEEGRGDEGLGRGRPPEVLVTVHRRESFGAPLRDIFSALRRLAESFPEVAWKYPVHRNPNVSGPAMDLLSGLANLELCEPLDYRELVAVLARCRFVLTDSGGLQEEAPAFGKPVLVLRETTERPEGIEAGVARLVGTDSGRIFAEASRLLVSPDAYLEMARAVNPYGDGQAADRIAAVLAGEPWTPFQPAAAGRIASS